MVCPLYCQMSFCRLKNFVNQIVNKFSKITETSAFSLPSKDNLHPLLANKLAADLLCAFWSGSAAVESSCPCSGPTTAPTRCCAVDCTPSLSGSGTRSRSSPPAISSPARTIQLSRVSHTAGAGCPTLVRQPGWPPTNPPPRRSSCPPPQQSTRHQAGLVFRPPGVHTFPATTREVGYMPGNRFYPTLWKGFCTPRGDLSFTASTEAVLQP
jgi:hypothetical protein